MSEDRAAKRKAKRALEDFRITVRRARRKKFSDKEALEEAERLAAELKDALKQGGAERIEPALKSLQDHLGSNLTRYRPNSAWETVKALAIAIAIAFVIRWTLVEPFRIPSGSMIPTLLVGDQLFVNKTVFGPDLLLPYLDPDLDSLTLIASPRFTWRVGRHRIIWAYRKLWLRRAPLRGEVVVFRPPFYPEGPYDDFIKRVIGVPGDEVEIRDGRLIINGKVQSEVSEGRYTGPVGEGGCAEFELFDEQLDRDHTTLTHPVLHCDPRLHSSPYYYYGPVTVPQGMALMMGDNRDRSNDSRFWGFAPISHFKGTAMFIHLPLDPENHYMPRWDRFFKWIK